MKQRIFILVIGLVGVLALVFFFAWRQGGGLGEGEALVSLGGHEFVAEGADTPTARAQGLSGRESLEEGRGMLFLFPEAEIQSFWMKEMNFPIDIIWLREGRVIGVERSAPAPLSDAPLSALPLYTSPGVVDMVFEVMAGTAERLSIKTGDKFVLRSKISDTIGSWQTSQ